MENGEFIIIFLNQRKLCIKICFISLTLYAFFGPSVITYTCNGQDNQVWSWNETDGTLKSKPRGEYLTVKPELEIWAGPLSGGSQAVVLLNRADSGSSEITVNWSNIGFPVDHSATVRDLWAHQDLGVFTGNYTSPKIDAHAVMMLNITLTKQKGDNDLFHLINKMIDF